jgi:hypothetical protein
MGPLIAMDQRCETDQIDSMSPAGSPSPSGGRCRDWMIPQALDQDIDPPL